MKLLLFTVLCFAAAIAAPADKQKRDILPGDPRYGTDYHQHHHHVNDNEVQTVKAVGGYVGSFAVPDDDQSDKPLNTENSTNEATRTSAIAHQVPATSYGIPDTVENINKNYLGPVIEQVEKNPTIKTNLNFDYVLPSIEVPSTYVNVKTIVQDQPTEKHASNNVNSEVYQTQQPAVVHKHVEASPQVKVASQTQEIRQRTSVPIFPSYTSYGSIPVKTVDRHVHVQVPEPYPVPVTKHFTFSVPVPQPVEVPKPYYVRVPQPVRVTVDRPYTVEVPRPVPYSVPHYVRTSIPVHLTTYGTTKQSLPWDGFLENLNNFPELLQNFPSFVSNFPQLVSENIPSFPNPFPGTTPSQPSAGGSLLTVQQSSLTPTASSSADAIAIENPSTKAEIIKPTVQPVVVQQTQEVYRPSTACAGCLVTNAKLPAKQPELAQSTNQQEYVQPVKQQQQQQEYVQPTDANGGYIY